MSTPPDELFAGIFDINAPKKADVFAGVASYSKQPSQLKRIQLDNPLSSDEQLLEIPDIFAKIKQESLQHRSTTSF